MNLPRVSRRLSPPLNIHPLAALALFGGTGEGDWRTINGVHVMIGKDGTIQKGPAHLVGRRPEEVSNPTAGVAATRTPMHELRRRVADFERNPGDKHAYRELTNAIANNHEAGEGNKDELRAMRDRLDSAYTRSGRGAGPGHPAPPPTASSGVAPTPTHMPTLRARVDSFEKSPGDKHVYRNILNAIGHNKEAGVGDKHELRALQSRLEAAHRR